MKQLKFAISIVLVSWLFILNGCGGGSGGSAGGSSPGPSPIPPTPANVITSFSISGATGVVTGTNIAVTLPFGTDATALTATFTTAAGYFLFVGNTPQISGVTVNNFTNPVTYRAVSLTSSSSLSKTATSEIEYIVTVTVSLSSDNSITSYSLKTSDNLYSATGVISGTNISVVMPFGTPSTTSLIATFVTTGSSVTVGGTTQQSGVTENNFTSPVSYLVTAFDGSQQTYTITVTIASSSDKAITSFVLAGRSGIITGSNIAVTVPNGTSLTSLVATFTTTGVSVFVGSTQQISGSTPNDFTSTVSYVVHAADGSTATYNVTVVFSNWTWMSGSSTRNHGGVYGTLGIPSSSNIPGTRDRSISWIDTSGNLWLFSGFGLDSTSTQGHLNDLWKYVPSTGQWTWVSGSNLSNQTGVYGTQGVANPANVPGGRRASISWIDTSGNLWLFGGNGFDSTTLGNLNDLWKYTPSTGQWTWMSGVDDINQFGVYGTQGVASPTNMPGSRRGSISWIDSSGNLWLFGGFANDSSSSVEDLNDLWKYNPSTGQWTWVSGSNLAGAVGVYGTQGVANPANVPGGRENSISWIDSSGNLWLFGGLGYDSIGNGRILNDLWKYNPSTGQWTWMSGANVGAQTGIYGTQGTPSPSNIPGSRHFSISWIDSSGNLWLFGGTGFDSTSSQGLLNDLWKYTPSTGQWTWVSGSNLISQSGVYGTQGVPAANNIPGSRRSSTPWIDSSGNLWLFGGTGFDSTGAQGTLNDLWKYNL
jgi:N-acetylneuraminic acid mutarotase